LGGKKKGPFKIKFSAGLLFSNQEG